MGAIKTLVPSGAVTISDARTVLGFNLGLEANFGAKRGF